MQNIVTRQIKCRCNLGFSCFFFVLLTPHKIVTSQTQLNTRISVNSIVNTAVAGTEAAKHLAVGGVNNRIAAKGSNVAFPKVNAALDRLQIC